MKYNIEDDDKRREKEEQIGRHEVWVLGLNLREIFRIIGVLNCSKYPGLKLTKIKGRKTWRNEVCMSFRFKFA